MVKNTAILEKTRLSNNASNSDENVSPQSSKEKVGFLIEASEKPEEKPEKNEINELKSNVDELANDVHNAVGDLKKSITDLRSSVTEMENPFNVLRTVTNVKELEKLENLNTGKVPPGVKSIVLGRPEEDTLSEKELYMQVPVEKPHLEEPIKEKPIIIPEKIVQEKPVPVIAPQPIAPSRPIKPSAYIDWIWELLDSGLTAENIRQLANLCEMTDYLPKQDSEFVYALAVTAEKIRQIGYTKNHLRVFMYKAAAISKTNLDQEDVATLIDLTDQQLKHKKKSKITDKQRPKKKNKITDQRLRPKKRRVEGIR